MNYDNEFVVERLKIPEEYVEGFYYFILDENEFLVPFRERNKTMCEFVLSKLSVEFLKMQEISPNE